MRIWPLTTTVYALPLLLGLVMGVANARTPEEIKSIGELRVAIRDYLPPMEFRDNGKPDGHLVGIDPELAEMLAQSLDAKPLWVFFKTATERESLLEEQKADVVISLYSVTEERMERVSFSESYFDNGSVILIRSADKGKIKTHKDLAGLRVATTKGSVSAKTIEMFMPDAFLTLLPKGIDGGYALLKDGKVDAVLYDKPMLDFIAAKNPAFHVVREDPLDPNQYAIGVNRQDKALLGHINQFLADLKSSGKLAKLLDKYSTSSLDLTSPSSTATVRKYTVREGDTLNKIAQKEYGNPSLWAKIYAYNRDSVAYADIIKVGQTLKLPDLPVSSAPVSSVPCRVQLRKLKALKPELSREVYQEKEREILATCLK